MAITPLYGAVKVSNFIDAFGLLDACKVEFLAVIFADC
jgi:hypothetical protein